MTTISQSIRYAQTADKFMVRLPDGMRDAIADMAKENHRSMNTEIVFAIEKHLAASGVELPSEPKPYNARLDMFVAAALTALVNPERLDVKHGDTTRKITITNWCFQAKKIGTQMLAVMEANDEPR